VYQTLVSSVSTVLITRKVRSSPSWSCPSSHVENTGRHSMTKSQEVRVILVYLYTSVGSTETDGRIYAYAKPSLI
jgi:hypothetical protein